ncbi:hypothetical protein FN846DRAFT_905080 [Sphaerosporella brunnea]|uniref:Uncharacterized protein n=1 Tax=Sphaerosporella brunnea TaxID=1250544 RepID=A0A5J5F2N0_9PEZI|nr:hypothetical protein FN846DRAFT_905080 [Sphaerosporella brunnea]
MAESSSMAEFRSIQGRAPAADASAETTAVDAENTETDGPSPPTIPASDVKKSKRKPKRKRAVPRPPTIPESDVKQGKRPCRPKPKRKKASQQEKKITGETAVTAGPASVSSVRQKSGSIFVDVSNCTGMDVSWNLTPDGTVAAVTSGQDDDAAGTAGRGAEWNFDHRPGRRLAQIDEYPPHQLLVNAMRRNGWYQMGTYYKPTLAEYAPRKIMLRVLANEARVYDHYPGLYARDDGYRTLYGFLNKLLKASLQCKARWVTTWPVADAPAPLDETDDALADVPNVPDDNALAAPPPPIAWRRQQPAGLAAGVTRMEEGVRTLGDAKSAFETRGDKDLQTAGSFTCDNWNEDRRTKDLRKGYNPNRPTACHKFGTHIRFTRQYSAQGLARPRYTPGRDGGHRWHSAPHRVLADSKRTISAAEQSAECRATDDGDSASAVIAADASGLEAVAMFVTPWTEEQNIAGDTRRLPRTLGMKVPQSILLKSIAEAAGWEWTISKLARYEIEPLFHRGLPQQEKKAAAATAGPGSVSSVSSKSGSIFVDVSNCTGMDVSWNLAPDGTVAGVTCSFRRSTS